MGLIGFTFTERELLLGDLTSSSKGFLLIRLAITEDLTSSYSFCDIRN